MKKNKKKFEIAIDGPAGSGKSTVAKLLANKLGFLYIDSGAMYRAVTYFLIRKDLLHKKDYKFRNHIKKIKIYFKNKNGSQFIYLNNTDVTKKIRTSLINRYVSYVSSIKIVRKEMVKRQREFTKHGSVVMDGRDIGTNVFKDATLKIYLTASSVVRAKRRLKDLSKLGENISLRKLIKEIHNRDNYDSNRPVSPLCKAQDAIVIDSTYLSVNAVLEKIRSLVII